MVDVDLGMGVGQDVLPYIICDKGNFDIYMGINRVPVEVNAFST